MPLLAPIQGAAPPATAGGGGPAATAASSRTATPTTEPHLPISPSPSATIAGGNRPGALPGATPGIAWASPPQQTTTTAPGSGPSGGASGGGGGDNGTIVALVVVIVVLALALCAVGAYFASKQTKEPRPDALVMQDLPPANSAAKSPHAVAADNIAVRNALLNVAGTTPATDAASVGTLQRAVAWNSTDTGSYQTIDDDDNEATDGNALPGPLAGGPAIPGNTRDGAAEYQVLHPAEAHRTYEQTVLRTNSGPLCEQTAVRRDGSAE